jgi:hypothetical protein
MRDNPSCIIMKPLQELHNDTLEGKVLFADMGGAI